jgi:L-cystine uptake protein TcyP (sodium:dicarboxylate symporter family)
MTGWSRIKNNYFKYLPVVYMPTVCLSIITGINNQLEKSYNKINHKASGLDLFFTVIGYSAIGIVTAITYPVSFPVIGIYTFSKNAIEISRSKGNKV